MAPHDHHERHRNDAGSADAQHRPAKSELEERKLELETRSLARQLSWQGTLIDWLKAATVPVTLLGAILAFYVGFGQLRQSEQNRTADRFDKALTRLASKNPIERITGVSSLRLFLFDEDRSLHRSSLHSLIDALAYEGEERVENAIADVFSNLKKGQISQEILNEAAKFAVQHNRSLTALVLKSSRQKVEDAQKKVLAAAGIVEQIPSPIPVSLINQLSKEKYLEFIDQYHGPFDRLSDEHRVPLSGLKKVMSQLIAMGAKIDDFSGINCEDCDFSPADNLVKAQFDRAFLSRANFTKVDLQGASFANADLAGTIFYRADLRAANLSFTGAYLPTTGFQGVRNHFPLLECARLEGANLNGIVLLVIEKSYATFIAGEKGLQFIAPKLQSAKIDGTTKLDKFGVVVVSSIGDSYQAQHADDEMVKRFFDRELRSGNKLFGSGWSPMRVMRYRASFTADAATYSDTSFIQRKDIEQDRLQGYNEDEVAILRTYIDQPVLRSLPIITQIAALKMGEKSPYKGHAWKLGAADQCTSEKAPRNLRLDTGMYAIGPDSEDEPASKESPE
ncbi:MAG TPA: pentapeptide repeat-containing protein [Beijerinckiaceae bacterium]|jgi:uncharacterized protein YjbI with pentapeptide repeats